LSKLRVVEGLGFPTTTRRPAWATNSTSRTKEAAGALTDDDDLRREGKADQAAGNAKEKIGDAADWAEKQVDNVKEKIDPELIRSVCVAATEGWVNRPGEPR
jgi:uncharacterized protein YjbJ (UPF0337 family)